MDYKNTLSMLNTKFEMKAGLTTKEALFLKHWEDINLYHKIREKEYSKRFNFHDGPPYANNSIHIGHSMNKTLKDFVVRYKGMNGFDTPYIPGWDTHGLPIEKEVQKSGVKRNQVTPAQYRTFCRDYAIKQVNKQRDQMRRLGLICDFDNPYMTMDKSVESKQIKMFAQMAMKGIIYKGLKPVYWSPASESALAEAEIEYADHTSNALFVAFNIKDGKKIIANDVRILIWTTTPWTLPANVAVCVNPKFTYGVYQTDFGKLLFLTDLKDSLVSTLSLTNCTLIKEVIGQQLEKIILHHPFIERDSLMIVGEHVSNDAGTGCVHTAPGHGAEDYAVGKLYNLPVLSPVDERGRMTSEAGERLVGLTLTDCDKVVIDILKEKNALLLHKPFVHSYPHDWRYHQPVLFRATNQWFINLTQYKKQLMDECEKVKWYPSWGEKRMKNMIDGRDEWCISRQRLWGVPIPIIYNAAGQPLLDQKIFDKIADIFAVEGSDSWYSHDASYFLPDGYPNDDYSKEVDIMDVWFDSGCTHTSVMEHFPSDLYLEGNDQYRGWFNSSLITAVLTRGHTPFKEVVTHGMVMDSKGDKMSKSLGNSIDPLIVINTYGADILRLWVAGVDYHNEVRIGDEVLRQVSELYRKVRNTFRFLLGNLSGLDKNFSEYFYIDRLILNKMQAVINSYHQCMNEYRFADALSVVTNFLSVDLSSFYLDLSKDVLYCDDLQSKRRLSRVRTVSVLLENMLLLIAPFIPFTAEEIYQHLPWKSIESIHLFDMPQSNNVNEEDLAIMQKISDLRDLVLKQLEEQRRNQVIGSSQEAEISMTVTKEYFEYLKNFDSDELAHLFIVSKVNCSLEKEIGILVSKHQGNKCPRCWNYHDEIELCSRCQKVIKNYE